MKPDPIHAHLQVVAQRPDGSPWVYIMRFFNRPGAAPPDPYIGASTVVVDEKKHADAQGFSMGPQGWSIWRFVLFKLGLGRNRPNVTRAEMAAAKKALSDEGCVVMHYERRNIGSKERVRDVPLRKDVT